MRVPDSLKTGASLHFLPWMICLLAICARLIPGPRTIDDSYITYRYARNILAGEGFVYNPGEQVLGTTTPLYTLTLVGLGALSGGVEAPFPQIAWLLNALLDAFTCLLLYQLGKRLNAPLAGIGASLAWVIAPFSVTFAIGGLETSLYVLLLVGTTYAHVIGRHILAAFLGSLSVVTRPDALILLSLIGLDRLWQIFLAEKGKSTAREIVLEALAFALPAGAWVIFATAYFGNPLPHSLVAKSLAYLLPGDTALLRLMQHYSLPFMEDVAIGVPWIAVGMILYPFLFILGALHALRATKRIWPFIIFPWFYFAVFAAANPLVFRWYLTPPLPPYMLFILTGAQALISSIAAQVANHSGQEAPHPDDLCSFSPPFRAILVVYVILAPTLMLLRSWTLQPDHGPSSPAPEMAWYKLELLYRQAADYVSADIKNDWHSDSIPRLAAGDVGVLGYFTPTRILDTVGLNSPETIKYYPLDPAIYYNAFAISPDLIINEAPNYLVILEIYGRGGLLKDPRFWEVYTLLHRIPTHIYSSDGMLIFARKAQ